MNNKEQLVYLAGPISGLSYREIGTWRNQFAKKLPYYMKIIHPLRYQTYLESEKIIGDAYEDKVLSSQKGLTERSRHDLMRCDLLVANLLNAKKVSIGTVMEIAWADILRKPIVLLMEDNNIHDHAMIREVSGFRVRTIEEAVDVVKAVLSY